MSESISFRDRVAAEITDRKGQRLKLKAFFLAHPETLFTQETLAESAGCHVSVVRSRISELKRDGLELDGRDTWHTDAAGKRHRGMKLWQYLPRPDEPLGRDARIPDPDQWDGRQRRLI